MLNVPRRHFLPWDRPLLPQAVDFLAANWTGGDSPLDLSRLLVVVPTRQSGRRLREALAGFAAGKGSAVFPPRVLTPEALVASTRRDNDTGTPSTASQLETLVAWVEVFQRADLAAVRDVFPVDPPSRSFAWALRLAEQFVRLQTTLGENDLRIMDVGAAAGEFPESARWEQLASLEQQHDARLHDAGLYSAFSARSGAGLASILEGIDRVVLLATVDPLPAAIRALGMSTQAIDVLVFAPVDCADDFDAWGRPQAERWGRRPLALPDFEQRVHLCADPAEQATRIAGLAKSYRRSAESPITADPTKPVEHSARADAWLGVGIADPDILPLLESEASRDGLGVFNPEGTSRRTGSLYHLLAALAACARHDGFETIESLVRCPDVLSYLSRRIGAACSPARVLAGLDNLRRKHLPADLVSARAHASGEIAAVLALIGEIRETLKKEAFPRNVAAVLAQLFAERVLESSREDDTELQDAAVAWTAVARECAAASRIFETLEGEQWWDLALRVFGESRRSEEKPPGAVEMQGWLELLYEDAPHLVVAGLNDALVPEAVSEDPFLPESLRARIGLKTNAARFARDAYLLQSLAAARRGGGRVDILFGKTSAAGDPMRPSRLLLRCPDNELPDRIAFLFRNPEPVNSHLPWSRAWKLRPEILPAPKQVAVTALRRWLACPLRFYLKYPLRMEAVDAVKSEMDAFDFGSLCHSALEAMGRDAAMRDCTEAAGVRDFLLRELTRQAHAKFGGELSLPLLIQIESARQRLVRFAEVQARERAAGWVIQEVERPFAVEIGGVQVKGKIDRIDRNVESGAIRVLDYKTSDTAVSPRAAHVRTIRRSESLPEWATVAVEGKLRAWADLQLPLYRHALTPAWGGAITCGYVNLPKAVGQTALSLWEDYTPDLQEHAMACAEAVCGAIGCAEFWPPNEDIRAESDEFAPLFHHGVADSIECPSSVGRSSHP